MAPSRRFTIADIAAMCGVSAQTVSRVVNGRPDVSAETRRVVEAAIARHGYLPSAVARTLAAQRSKTIGVLAAGLHLRGVSEVLTGIAEACEELGYALLLKELRTVDHDEIVRILQFFASHQVEGVIFDGAQLPQQPWSAELSAPDGSHAMVFLKCEPLPGRTTLGIDNVNGQSALVRHVLALGRRRLGYVSGPAGLTEARQRLDGWERTLLEAAVEPGPVYEGNWSCASGAAALRDLLRRDPALDAVVAANDQMALGVLHEASRLGIRVPGRLAVTGFDGAPESAYYIPPLTTATQPLRELGAAAVTAVLEEASGLRDSGRVITFDTTLEVRESAPAIPYRIPGMRRDQ